MLWSRASLYLYLNGRKEIHLFGLLGWPSGGKIWFSCIMFLALILFADDMSVGTDKANIVQSNVLFACSPETWLVYGKTIVFSNKNVNPDDSKSVYLIKRQLCHMDTVLGTTKLAVLV